MMRGPRFAVLGCALAALVLSGCLALSVAERNAEHARRTNALLAEAHVTRRAPDDIISQRAWTNILESCDADHLFFRGEDIRQFESVRLKLDDALRANDFSFVFTVRARYRMRLAERVAFVRETLTKNRSTLPTAGTYRFDRKDLPWPSTRAEQDALWRAHLADELLDEELGREVARKSAADDTTQTPAAAVLKRYESMLAEDKLTEAEAADLFLAAVVSAYDPHSLYLAPEEFAMFQSEMNLKLCGVGAQLEFGTKGAVVTRVLPGGPIEKDGRIHAGDCIVGVAKDGEGKIEPLAGKSQMEGVKLLRGEKGTKVTLEIAHKGASGTQTYTLTRNEIKLEDEAASSRVLTVGGKKIGYLRLPQFYAEMDEAAGYFGRRTCSEDLKKQLLSLSKAQVAGVVFDLRDNPGGSLDDAAKILGYFLRGGPAVSLKNPSREVVLPIPENTVICEVPLVVLTTRGSASASELVSGTLQDYGRAVIVGDDHTFGKGTAQEPKELAEDGEPCAIMLTGDLFYRAGGTSTQRCGVTSDIVVESIAGDLEDGEAELPYALVGDRLERKDFAPAWDLAKFVPELTRLSVARRARSKAWQKYLPFVRQARDYQSRKVNPLDRAARKAQMQQDESLRKESRRLEKIRRGKKAVDQDPVLQEGVAILLDLVRLNAGRKLPARAETAVTGAFTDLDDD